MKLHEKKYRVLAFFVLVGGPHAAPPSTLLYSMARNGIESAQSTECLLGRLSLDLLQEILVRLPLRSRLQPALSAKFLWLAASSPMTDGQAEKVPPLGALLPPLCLGVPCTWAPVPSNVFPPSRVSQSSSHWLLAGQTCTVVPTPKGNPKTLKNLGLSGGGTGALLGETKWSGVNFVRGVRLVNDIELAPHSDVVFVGCRIEGYIKQLAHGSLTLIECTLVRVARSEQVGSSTLGRDINGHDLGDPGVKVGTRGKLTMLGCRVTGPRDKPDIAARNYSEIDIQDCIFESGVSCGNLSVGYQAYGEQVAETPARFHLEGCTFKPTPLTQMGADYIPPEEAEDDVFLRGSRSVWYTGAVAHECRVRDNDFGGGLMFWQLLEGMMLLENNTFHGSCQSAALDPYQAGTEDGTQLRRSSSHVEVFVMDGATSTAVVKVRGAPTWLRHEARNGASIQTDTR